MKLIHISDTHIGREDNLQRLGMVVDDLLAHPPDVPENCLVIHTGDVIDSATDVHRLAGKTLLKRLAERYRVLLCPGNHDYGDAMSVNAEPAKKFREVFNDYIFQGKPPTFPVIHEVGGEYVFIGLDSNAATLSFFERWFAEGHLGKEQLADLNKALSRPELQNKKIIVYLHHHPFSCDCSVMPDMGGRHLLFHLFARLPRPFRRMKDASSFCKIVRDRVHMLLFGHMHFGLDCSGDSRRYGVPVALDGGSSTCTGNEGDRIRYRIIDLQEMTYKVRAIPL